MLLVSEKDLPIEDRDTADSATLRSTLESLERDVKRMLEDPLFDMLQINYEKLRELNEGLKNVEIEIDGEDKVYDRWLKYVAEGKKIAEACIYLRENSMAKHVIAEEGKRRGMSRRARD